ncbi:hypothetical protein ACB376_15560 [Klebsiella electrica]|uniref:hypothetical protein n=1 Tax=Klebsiella electrica TaxID=1259973 RepID=UPI002556CB25|nr:hypothetical protein [Klebsiella electrica]WIO42945.1 hypothetical protein P2G42_24405 [Klebsiella electrica]
MIARQSEKQLIERSFCRYQSPEKPRRLSGELPQEGNIFRRFFIDLDYGSAQKFSDIAPGRKAEETRPDAALRGVILLSHRSAERDFAGIRRVICPASRRSAGQSFAV